MRSLKVAMENSDSALIASRNCKKGIPANLGFPTKQNQVGRHAA